MTGESQDTDPRAGRDRRRRPTRPWDVLFHPRRRRRYRRGTDLHPGRVPVVDRFPVGLIGPSILLLVLTIVDGVFTWLLIEHQCEEANPLMAAFVERGLCEFLAAKYALTAVGLTLLLLMQGYPMFGTRFRVGHFIPMLVALYLVLLGYQFHLYRQAPAAIDADRAGPAFLKSRSGP